MFVRDIMTPNPVSIHPDATVREGICIMIDNSFEAVPVRENGKIVGILTDWDVLVHSGVNGSGYVDTVKVSQIMTSDVITISPDEIIEMAAYHMYFHDVDALPVVNKDDELVGIVTQSDLFRAFVTFMGLNTKGTRITIDVADRPGVLADITRIVKEVGMSIASLSTFVPPDKRRGNVIVRVKSCHAKPLVDRLVEKGYWVVHVSQVWE